MIASFEARHFDKGEAAFRPVRVTVHDDGTTEFAELESEAVYATYYWGALKVTSRIGSTPRRITLPDGGVIETNDNDTVDLIERKVRGHTRSAFAHKLERLTIYTAVTVVVLAAVLFAFVRYGVPQIASSIAFSLPQGVLDFTAEQTIDAMDFAFFDDSNLSAEAQDRIKDHFNRVLEFAAQNKDCCELIFRNGGPLDANAFALPNGTVLMTDQLVELAENDNEIIGVLAHEVGHVERRHAMRSMLQSSLLALMIVFVTGDLAEVTELALGLPVFFVQVGFSRNFEREADLHALETLEAMDIDPAELANLLERLNAKCGEACSSGWLSTHPSTEDRGAMLRGGEIP